MKSLEQLDLDFNKKVGEDWEKFCDSIEFIGILSKEEYFSLRANFLFGEKYREMHGILTVLEEYLKYNSTDGKEERQPLRKKLKEMLNAL